MRDNDLIEFCGGKFTCEEIEKFREHIQKRLDIIYKGYKCHNATVELMDSVQYEIDKVYGGGIFRVTYDKDVDPYSFSVVPINCPVVMQMVLEVNSDERETSCG